MPNTEEHQRNPQARGNAAVVEMRRREGEAFVEDVEFLLSVGENLNGVLRRMGYRDREPLYRRLRSYDRYDLTAALHATVLRSDEPWD